MKPLDHKKKKKKKDFLDLNWDFEGVMIVVKC